MRSRPVRLRGFLGVATVGLVLTAVPMVALARASAEPGAASSVRGFLAGISCPEPRVCVAVGSSASGSRTLIQEGHGVTFYSVKSPNLGNDGNGLASVSCPTATVCFSAGGAIEKPGTGEFIILEERNGVWSTAKVPEPRPYDFLNGISCSSPSHCVAVGMEAVRGRRLPIYPVALIEMTHGWRLVGLPEEGDSSVEAISCPSLTACFAVGSSRLSNGLSGLYIVEEGGSTWKRATFPRVVGTFAELLGVSCWSAGHCVAVGDAQDRPVALIMSGNRWTRVKLPRVAGSSVGLTSVSCSQDACTAVGWSSDGSTIVLREINSGPWRVVHSGLRGRFTSVSCFGIASCVAVAISSRGSFYAQVK